MRATNAGIDSVLAGTARFAADLYTFFFAEGTTRWTGANTDLSYGGNTWLATGPVISRGGGRTTVGLEVATLGISLAPGALTLGGQSVKLAAMRGSFSGIRVLVERAYMSTWGTIPGLVTIFDGVVQGDPEIGSTEVRVTVKSAPAKLADPGPARLIQPQCPWQFGSAQCGAVLATWQHTRTAAAGSTAASVVLSSSSTMANVGGIVVFTSGALSGTRRAIRAVAGSTLTLAQPLGAAPAVGDGITITKGCDKTRTACNAFSRIATFGGYPDTPKPESTASGSTSEVP